MNIQKIAGLATMAFTAGLLAACSGGTPAPVGGGDSNLDEDGESESEAKLPQSTKKPSSTSGEEPKATPTTPPTEPVTPGAPATPGQPGTPATPGQPGQPGQVGRVSVNEHCCYGGAYFRCPSSAACFGGFDVGQCLAQCAGPQDPCFDACFDKLDAAGAPTGCQSNVQPPNGVDCANGSINL